MQSMKDMKVVKEHFPCIARFWDETRWSVLIDERIQEKKSSKGFLTGITLNVFMIGLVSFLTDASSEIIYPLMPAFLALASVGHGVAPALLIGILEGFAETASALLKLAGGIWTDRVRRKKPLILAGYGISSVFRPLVGLAAHAQAPLPVHRTARRGDDIKEHGSTCALSTSPRSAGRTRCACSRKCERRAASSVTLTRP